MQRPEIPRTAWFGLGGTMAIGGLTYLFGGIWWAVLVVLVGFLTMMLVKLDVIGGDQHGHSVVSVLPQDSVSTPRPKVMPLRYAVSPDSMSREGVYVVNEGEIALDVRIPEISLLDGWVLHFDTPISHLNTSGFFQATVSKGNDHSTSLEGVWVSLRQTDEMYDDVPFLIEYRGFDGHGYRSQCRISMDNSKYPPFQVKFKGDA
jgi:hypothetical protein